MRHFLFLALLLAALPPSAIARPPQKQPGSGPEPGFVRVRIETSVGPIVVALDARRAPRTTANFLAYVDDGRFDGTSFYRAARNRTNAKYGFIQGGIDTDARRSLPPIPLERTSVTGIRHLDATISMAHGRDPDSAMGNFFITVGAVPSLDAQGEYPGYAAFGHVVSGMEAVRRILALPTGGGEGAMKGQKILKPIALISAKRLDGTPRPTKWARPWLLDLSQIKRKR